MTKQKEVQELSIKVNIADRQYPLKIQAGDEENLRKAAKKVNERLREYTENYAVADKLDALAMIALELATELSERGSNGIVDHQSELLLRDIEERLDLALKKNT